MRLRIVMIVVMLLGIRAGLFAQNAKNIVNIGDGKLFYSAISSHITKNMDTLSSLSVSGTMFVRFEIGLNGVGNIKCSSSAPQILKKIISEALLKTDKVALNSKALSQHYYVLPVEYDFINSGQPKSLSALIQQIPNLSEDSSKRDPNDDFASLFEITKDNSGGLYGINCILLQTIKIRGKLL